MRYADRPDAAASFTKEQVMSIAKVIEVTAASPNSVEDAVRSGLKKVAETVKNIKGAWVNETKVVTDGDGNVVEWRVTLKVTFLVE
jgi:flavin-binding protein dodecin